MAIPIIGAPRPGEKPRSTDLVSPAGRDAGRSALPPIDADLPPPGTAPEGKRPLSDELIRSLLQHPSPLVRGYAVEQASRLTGDAWSEALLGLVADPNDIVAADAIHAIEMKKYRPAAKAIAERFTKAPGGEVAAVAAAALGELAPDQLLEAVAHRGRLDDEAYAATATALARTGSEEVIDFLGKALNRAGALSPERRGALYGAALLSGSTDLSNRVLSLALADSKHDEPEDGSFPSRSALAAVGGLALPYSRKDAGLELFDHLRTALETDVIPILPESARAALEAAMVAKRSGAMLAALGPVLDLEQKDGKDSARAEYGNVPQRRRGLVRALLARKDEIDQLELKAAAVFLAAAVQAATVILVGEGNEETSPAIATLSKALEIAGGPAELARMSSGDLAQLFSSKSEHQIRRVLSVLTHEQLHHTSTLRRFIDALVKTGHGGALFEAAAEVGEQRLHHAVIASLAESGAGEAIVVDALTRTPFEAKLARLALAATEEIRTERIALAIGRRFTELREASRAGLIRAVLRLGDPRLMPVIEQRAWPDEPEELAWTILSLVHDAPQAEKLTTRARARVEKDRSNQPELGVRLPLACTRCKEVLSYVFEHVLLDIDAKDQLGDPAFVGELVCKACGAEEELETTEEAARILTTHMLEFLDETRRGQLSGPPLVSPAQTDYRGKKVGFQAALRALDREVEASPGSIRPRLHRARLRLVLKRRRVEDDIAAVMEIDPKSPEALALQAALKRRAADPNGALETTIAAHRLLTADPPARLYEADDPAAFRRNIEDFIVDLERDGAGSVPEEIDLSAARKRRADRDAEVARMRAEINERARAEASAASGAAGGAGDEAPRDMAALAEAFQKAGRNDPCPCGSGKKFKKCHGKGQ